jgi:site-specific DNA-methyltransferase (adenine-specific)
MESDVLLEPNKIYNYDFVEGLKFIDDESVDLILTDIPYNVSRDNNFKTMKDRKGRNGIDFGEWDKGFNENSLNDLTRVLKKGGSLFMFHAFEQYETIRQVLNGLNVKDKIIWQKTNPMPRNRDRRWISDIEIASWFVKKGDKWTFNRQNEKYETSVLRYPAESGGGHKRHHPTQKNLKLIEYILNVHSNEGDLVLDPFIGGGTTAIGCINNNRKYIGFEIDIKYCDVANERIKQVHT